jgi:hypothetical protein
MACDQSKNAEEKAMIEFTEDPHDSRATRLYDELRSHRQHIRHVQFNVDTCRYCRHEIDMIRQG